LTAIRNNTLPSPNKGEAEAIKLQTWIAQHRQLLEVFLDAYCIVDLNNRVVDFNVAFTELCGESYRKILKIADFCKLVSTEMCPDNCPARQIVNTKGPVRLDELNGASKAHPELQMILGGVPIVDELDTVLGALLTIRNVSAESELQKKYDEKKKDSITDGLTQLYNKMYTETILLRQIKTSFREETKFSLVMCDIDHFKKVNDTHGHQAGDYILSNVAKIMLAQSRDTDLVGRFGGEEFVAILANTDDKGARIFCERFRKRIEETSFMFEGTKIPITVSLGTGTFNKKWQPGLLPEDEMKLLTTHADIALYHAKASGRNNTCQFESLSDKQKSAGIPKKPETKPDTKS
jgi:diguanylate cyclase (GGDEF)-like protein